jgi:glycosyltransferase involved in cell wall biosynthesis
MTALASSPNSSPAPAPADGLAAIAPRRTVRVLFVNDTARNGGPGRSLHSILKFLDPAAVRRIVVLPREGAVGNLISRDRAADELHFLPDLVENPIEPWGRPMEREDFAAAPTLRAARLAGNAFKATRGLVRLSALARRSAIDLVYCNGTNADFAGGLLSLVGAPALWHVRYSSLPRAVAGVHRRLSASAGVRRVVCVSSTAAALFSHCPGKVTVIHNALDLDEFGPGGESGHLRAELGLGSDVVVFGSHGRVLRRKGYIEMVRAARIALDRMSGPERSRVAFAVVGDTPQDFRPDHVEECRALVAELGLRGHVHLVGFRADVRPLVADFDVAVVPSVYPDPLPRAVMESMALAKPVIAFAVGGVAEMLDDGVTGELVAFEPERPGAEAASPKAVDRLADAILRYARDGDLRTRQGAAARARATRDFDARSHARRIQNEIVVASGLGSEAGR